MSKIVQRIVKRGDAEVLVLWQFHHLYLFWDVSEGNLLNRFTNVRLSINTFSQMQ